MAGPLPTVRLRHGCVKPLYAGHPWVFADAIAGWDTSPAEAGDEVRVLDDRGKPLGRGYYSPRSAIAVRLLTRRDEPAGEDLLVRRLESALRLRREVLALGTTTTAYRLVHSEGDGLGGLVVDVYGDCLTVSCGTVGMHRRREFILGALERLVQPKGILDRSSARVLELERLTTRLGSTLRGELPAEPFEVLEDGLPMLVDLRPGQGQKTGLFLDQRENRRRVGALARGRDVLDGFSYTGGFALHAARGGAKSLALLDASEPALALARRNLERNAIADADLVCGEYADGLRQLREQGRAYDLIVLDPPKFAPARSAVPAALAGYRELNTQAARLLRPGALLVTCSCSANVPLVEFERAVARGLADAGWRAALLERRGAAPDHPVPPGFEQGEYLKCLVLRVEQ